MELRDAAVYAIPLVGLACAVGIRRLGVRSSALVGLLLLIALFLPTSMLVSRSYFSSLAEPVREPVRVLLQVTVCLVSPLALVAASSLLCLAVSLRRRARALEGATAAPQVAPARADSLPAVVLGVLAVLLLARTLYDLYWFVIWDSTGDSWEWLWLIPLVAAALLAGVLSIGRPGIARRVGLLYVPLAVCLLIAVYASAKSVDFRQLTESHAGQVTQAIETYYAREGSYPGDLGQLSPRYALWLPEPVIIYGQDWCYDSGDDYFRIGYVYREHWSSPDLIGRLYASRGAAPVQPGICQSEIAALKAQQASHW